MNHTPFIVGAYAAFVVFLAWDFLAPRLALRRLKRELGERAERAEQRRQR
jgi:heme exporter protein D